MKSFRSKHRIISFVVGVFLALSVGASAAWVIVAYSGLNGSGGGNFSHATPSTVGALTYTGGTASAALNPQDNIQAGLATVTLPITIHNNDPANAHTVASLSRTFTSTPSQCASHLDWANTSSVQVGTIVPAGGNVTGSIDVTADGTLPAACSDGSWTITFAGTTT